MHHDLRLSENTPILSLEARKKLNSTCKQLYSLVDQILIKPSADAVANS